MRMRKENLFLSFIAAIFAFTLMVFTACSSCNKEKPADNDESQSKTEVVELITENVISLNRQDMFAKFGGDYRWFETCIVLKDYLDAEECDGTVSGVSNVFQVINENDGKTFDVHVYLYTTTPDTTVIDEKQGFWVEDMPLNDEAIKVTFAEAYENVMKANIVKPHSRQVVLRKEVGPVSCNPQYIFGNSHAQVYVDATTGEVSAKNPAFPDNFAKPLGEWP
jgi:hypothetical protein